MKQALKSITIIIILSVIPILLGLPFTLIYHYPVVIEVTLFIFGALELLIMNVRNDRKARKTWRVKDKYNLDKTSEEYLSYSRVQYYLLISGVINILLSIVYFQIFEKNGSEL
jgi:hypothetical protein